jgi:hypothetical protein
VLIAVFTVSFLLILGIASGSGSELVAVEVLQPIDIENVIVLSGVTYVGYFGSPYNNAFTSVAKTCDSNDVSPPYAPSNRNGAFNAGFRVRVEAAHDSERPLFGDTMRVVLTVPGHAGASAKKGWPDTMLVAATTQCILVNAAQDTAVRFVDLRVEGRTAYARFNRVYSTRRYRHGPLTRVYP